jgi:hypothetical protein
MDMVYPNVAEILLNSMLEQDLATGIGHQGQNGRNMILANHMAVNYRKISTAYNRINTVSQSIMLHFVLPEAV